MLLLRFWVIWTFLGSVTSRVLVPQNVSLCNATEDIVCRSATTSSSDFQQLTGNDLGETDESGSDDLNCYCDDLCPVYDDCCPVFALDFNLSTKIAKLPAEVVTCQNFRSQPDRAADGIYVVSRCPYSYSEDYIRERCELSESSSEPFLRLPVNGNRSGLLYGNYYCAVCNGEPDVVFWTAKKVTSTKLRKKPAQLSMYDIIDIREKLNFTFYVVFVSPKGHKMRSCKSTSNHRCIGNSSGRTKTEKCPQRSQLSAYSYEYPELELIRSQRVSVCETNRSDYRNSTNRSHGEANGRRRVSFSGRSPLMSLWRISFAIIFDLNSKSITVNQNGIGNESMNATKIPDCDWGMLYDPFAEVCRSIFCRCGFQLTSSGCVLVNDTNCWDRLLLEPFNCSQMIRLNDTEFMMLSNDSTFVYKTESAYSPGEFIHSPPYIYICSEVIDEVRHTTVDIAPLFHFDRVQGIGSFVGVLISLIALSIQFVIYMMFPVLRNIPGKCVVCLVVSIFSGQLSFLFVTHSGPVCRYLAAFMHLSFLSSFCWMNVLALDICKAFASKVVVSSRSRTGSKRFMFYSVYAWSVPAAIVGLCLGMDILKLDVNFRPYYGETVCWITSQMGLVAFFLVPVAVILVSNFILFGITVFCLRRSSKASETVVEKTRSKDQLFVYFKLSIIMGLTWTFGFIATLTQWTAMWYLFIMFNTLQGAFLCLTFVCTKNVLQLMKGKALLISRNSLSSKNPMQETRHQVCDSSIRKTRVESSSS